MSINKDFSADTFMSPGLTGFTTEPENYAEDEQNLSSIGDFISEPSAVVSEARKLAVTSKKAVVFENLFLPETLEEWNKFLSRTDIIIVTEVSPPAPPKSSSVIYPKYVEYYEVDPRIYNIALIVGAYKANFDPATFKDALEKDTSKQLLLTIIELTSEGKGLGWSYFYKRMAYAPISRWTLSELKKLTKQMFSSSSDCIIEEEDDTQGGE